MSIFLETIFDNRSVIRCVTLNRDIFTAQLSPKNFEFGHVMESPSGWEERYERKDLATQRHQGKVT